MESVVLAKTLAAVTGIGAIGITAISVPFITPAFRRICLPYLPATTQQLANFKEALLCCPKCPLVDLGSGDGRVVFEASKYEYKATGVELNAWLVMYSRLRSYGTNCHDVRFVRRNMWKFNISEYGIVVIFGAETMMGMLQEKINAELKAGSHVITCRFPLPASQPIREIGEGIDTVWLYKKD